VEVWRLIKRIGRGEKRIGRIWITTDRDCNHEIKKHSSEGCKSWTIKKAECWRIDAFELWCWRRLLRVPWTAKRSSQSILKEISPECSLDGLMLKLKLQYYGHMMQRANSLEKALMLRNTEGKRSRGRQRMRRLDGITNAMDMNLRNSGDSGGQRKRRVAVRAVTGSRARLSDWTTAGFALLVKLHFCFCKGSVYKMDGREGRARWQEWAMWQVNEGS